MRLPHHPVKLSRWLVGQYGGLSASCLCRVRYPKSGQVNYDAAVALEPGRRIWPVAPKTRLSAFEMLLFVKEVVYPLA